MRKKRAALVSVFSNSLLIAIKTLAGVLSGSISVLSEALHSLMDLMASLIAYFSVKQASLPPDKEHPFGHGKMENLSGFFESVLLIIAAGIIIFESIKRLLTASEIRFPAMALIVMGISAVVNIIVSRHLFRVARETDSLALEADAKHLSADVYTSLGVFIGLVLVLLTEITMIDSLIAILVALYIAYEGAVLARKSVSGLMDVRLPDHEEKKIREILNRHKDELKGYHKLRTRKSGSERHIDFHAVLCTDRDISTTHDIMETIEKELQVTFPDTTVLIHPEPCYHQINECPTVCHWDNRKKKRNRGST